MNLRSLITLEECATMLNGIVSAERLRELADGEYLPHVVVDGQICVEWGRVEIWVSKNLVSGRCTGQNLPGIITVPRGPQNLPEPLRPMRLVIRAIRPPEYPAGIYFLCRDGRVIYVGQSVAPVMRVYQHRRTGRDFEDVFYVAVPEDRLSEVEGAMIRFFKPEMNGPGPVAAIERDADVLTEFGLVQRPALPS